MNETKNAGAPLALTPPMGWNSYNTFGCEPTEKLLLETTDVMVSHEFLAAGYKYVNIDDGWMAKERDHEGNLIPHPDKFPNGLQKVTDYIHSRGLKAGIYLGAGLRTYGEYPGSLGHEEKDAKLIADLGFDLLKYDYRALSEDPPRDDVKSEYRRMRDLLIATGRPILFSICEHGRSRPWEWGKDVGHIWRNSPDIKDGFDGQISWGWGFKKILDETHHLHPYAGPGSWNDPDMLIVGLNGKFDWQGKGCTLEEYKSHFALWCLSASPLFMGCDIRSLDSESKTILLNRHLISLNQDPLGKQAYIVHKTDNLDIWLKPMSGEALALGVFNHGPETEKISLDWQKLGINPPVEFRFQDSWTGQNLGQFKENFPMQIESHGTVVLHLERIDKMKDRT